MNEAKRNEESDLTELLYSIDNGRFERLRDVLKIDNVCWGCSYFNQTLEKTPYNTYRCNCAPSCIAATLNPALISYLLWRTGIKTEEQHNSFLGI